MTETAEMVWNGAESIRQFLVPIDSLEPFPDNPRRSDIEELRRSYRRWGQVKTILVDGNRIVAGHHMRLALMEEGCTHIAAQSNEFADDEERLAYLLADNRLGEKGSYNDGALAGHLKFLAELEALEGTGYSNTDVDDLLARIAQQGSQAPPVRQVSFKARDPSATKELVLLYSPEQHTQVEEWLGRIQAREGVSGASEAVYIALEQAAAR